MKKFVIITDSCSDLNKELRTKYDIEYVPMHFSMDGKDYKASLDWEDFSVSEFYNHMRNGKRFLTAQVIAEDYKKAFTEWIEKGYDVLSISCSSALSASINASRVVREQLLEKYPDAKIYCIDSLNSSFGLGILCIQAAKLREEGKSIDQVAEWLEEKKLTANQECTVEKLSYLKQAGRVSAASAFFGGLLNIKPIIISDAIGQNHAVEKVKGRQTSIERLAERFAEEVEDVDYQNVCVCHADNLEDGLKLKAAVESKLKKPMDITMGYIGPIVGASAGPGTLAVYFFGKEVTVNKK